MLIRQAYQIIAIFSPHIFLAHLWAGNIVSQLLLDTAQNCPFVEQRIKAMDRFHRCAIVPVNIPVGVIDSICRKIVASLR
jgi:hypothetical protein